MITSQLVNNTSRTKYTRVLRFECSLLTADEPSNKASPTATVNTTNMSAAPLWGFLNTVRTIPS